MFNQCTFTASHRTQAAVTTESSAPADETAATADQPTKARKGKTQGGNNG